MACMKPTTGKTTVSETNNADAKNREIVQLCGFRTEATGSVLANLAQQLTRAYLVSKYVIDHPSVTFEPFYFFFYGSLQAKRTLVRVCGLEDANPTLIPASIKDWRIMMWGTFPALVPAEGNEVKGMCWKCESPEHVGSLRRYETNAYRMAVCKITTDEGEVIENGRIFVSTEREEQLIEGDFDLKSYIRRHGDF